MYSKRELFEKKSLQGSPMKLNKRLRALSEMVTEPYNIVWDCCCDHGLLGFKILSDGLVKQVNFVDVVPDIIQQLGTKLTQYGHHLPADSQWQVLCQDISELALANNKEGRLLDKQLLIISGVGGDLMIEFITQLMQRYAGQDIDFLLSPVQHTYKLRSALLKLNFKLKRERLVIDNGRGYEMLLVNQLGTHDLTLTGQEMWKQQPNHLHYLVKLIAHYQRIVETSKDHVSSEQAALNAYHAVQLKHY